jgi:protein SCO1/2
MTQLPNPSSNPDQPPRPAPSPYRWLIIVLGLFVAVLAYVRMSSMQPQPQGAPGSSGLRKLSTVPPFSLTERSGRIITNHDLAGKLWVADFVYTTCPGPCPIITAGMAKIQDAVANDPHVQLVSFTVDPESDTPPVLAKYADQFKADPNRWWFLTGPEKPLFSLIQNGFLQAVQDNSGAPLKDGEFKVTHSTYICLVDGDGNVRGFYDGVGADGRADVLRDIKVLEKEAGQ